jgi:NodT family efflux transporter outer membrane factor (OMF) lipoprotein
VAQTYVQLARLVAQREVARQSLAQRDALLALTRERVGAGLDSQVELRQSEGALPDARVQIEQLSEQIALTRHALAALAAQPPETYATLTPTLAALQAVALPASVPADLLGRRADIAAARWRVEAATQGMAAAKAQFYPNVNLSAFIGLSSIGLDRLVESGSRQYGVGPAIRLPIFDSGALRANLRGKTAEVDAAVDSYNGALVEAVREVADALQSLQSIARQQTEQALAQAATDSAFDFATQRYRAGLSNQLTLLNAETAMLAQRRAAVDLRARTLSTQAALIRALGGGYASETPLPSLPASVARRD